MTLYRTDHDGLGDINVPADALYGPNARRAVDNFAISSRTLGDFPQFVEGFGQVKAAAALANTQLGLISENAGGAIVAAADELIDQRHNAHLVVDMLEGSGGTSLNMNVNEVLANRAAQLLGGMVGAYDLVHPNDHVNRCQSTNDVVPSAIKVGCRIALGGLIREVDLLVGAFEERAERFSNVYRLGRTCLQDAQPMTLGQAFGAYCALARRLAAMLREREEELLVLPIGATAIGTGFGAAPGYREAFFQHLQGRTGTGYDAAEDMFDALSNADVFTRLSGELRAVATSIAKIANDFQLLSSGPTAGFGELLLPTLQAGSSIMPGKINPVVPMAICQLGFTLTGYDVIVATAAQQGQLEINPYEPVIAFHLFEGMRLLTNGLRIFREKCVAGVEANIERMEYNLLHSSAIATAMLPTIGYERASTLVRRSLKEAIPFAELVVSEGLMQPQELHDLIGAATGAAVAR
ncbi:aspartate ammonia-lyase [Sphingobium sp. JAI105]|uniref:aspartate ammonia-lyase n=1 Tax=Sphingobium sp. JAI105 TaxID=2787715 RepID=UPI0018CA3F37|nr:aspartate ammonia-lyase [Sphingobium sp. JAI105]MBG6118459.1 aspartate ammonia-lyase [Sphingobium sp. JAI105]